MSKLTQKFLDKLMKTQDELNSMYEELRGYAHELNAWEEENLGIRVTVAGTIVNVKADDKSVKIKTYDYDEYEDEYEFEEQSFPLHKLLNDDWKEEALKAYQAKLEKEKKEQCMKEEARAREAEEKERAEYERLKAKFEKQ